ncbi:MAG: lytic transglycosylase domain-containing protein [Actinobacteria bacterium]|nr:lytic transglycosylase domain-containing protein [Actinomycetota bacterium]
MAKRRKHNVRYKRSDSFLVWYRSIPLALIVLLVLATVVSIKGPHTVKAVYYPLEYTQEIAESSARHEVNPYWVCALIESESAWDSDVMSDAGAIGLMQLLPETAKDLADWGIVDASRYPPENLKDPAVNIEYGTAYIRYLVERYHEMEPAVAAYNAGLGNVDEWLESGEDIRDTIDFPETATYLLRVVRAKELYEELYPDAF